MLNISSDEIKKYPYVYMENIISSNNKEASESLVCNYVPYLFTEYDTDNLNNSVSYDKEPLSKFIFDMSRIHKFFKSNNTVSDSKKFILDILKNTPNDDNLKEYSIVIKNTCENILKNIKTYQYENKLLESALVNFSPIVPYSGTIKQPNLTESTITNKQNENIKPIVELLNKPDQDIKGFIKSTLINNIFDILTNSNKFIKNDNYDIQYNVKNNDTDNLLPSDIISLLLSNTKYDVSVIYFILSYIYYSFKREDYPNLINKLSVLDDTIKNILTFDNKVSVETAVEAFSIFSLPSINDSILDIDISENMEYENDRKISKLIDMADVDYDKMKVKNYNLDKLLAFFYNSRRYKTNSYTNSLFLNNNESISGYSYIETNEEPILVCEIDDKYLIIPVMDLSDNYKMKLISIDKNNNIEINTNFDTIKN
jgi:hypothetical protein